ncbi:hypothetical protein [Qipengyuania sp. JC766]|uniref:hypothetical protein n=1 Tax=Qipengyuania sp. JC766 TaxID=3232139 RepID=UPI00345743EE
MRMLARLAVIPLCLVASACGQSDRMEGPQFDGSIEDRARFVAQGVQWWLPMEEDGFSIHTVRADGRELVLEADTSLDRVGEVSPFELTKILRPVVCKEGYRGFIEAGGVIRFDIRDPDSGQELPPARVGSCLGVS